MGDKYNSLIRIKINQPDAHQMVNLQPFSTDAHQMVNLQPFLANKKTDSTGSAFLMSVQSKARNS